MKRPHNHKLVFILGVHKSGTSLLRSLLDDHDEIFAIPFESHIAHLLNWETRYPLRAELADPHYKKNTFFDRAIQWIEASNTVADPYADSQLLGKFDVSVFKKALLEGSHLEAEADLILHYFYAINQALGRPDLSKNTRIVEKSVENLEHVPKLKKLFPDAVFVTIVRNPYANLVTLRKYFMKMDTKYPLLDRGLRSIRDGFYFAEANKHLVGSETTLTYESILSHPEKVMKKVATELQVEYSPSLLQPTSMGQAWGGNSVHDKQFTGISDKNLDRWKGEINDLEIDLVNQHLSQVLERFAYARLNKPLASWKPQKKEGLRAYLANRVLLKRG